MPDKNLPSYEAEHRRLLPLVGLDTIWYGKIVLRTRTTDDSLCKRFALCVQKICLVRAKDLPRVYGSLLKF